MTGLADAYQDDVGALQSHTRLQAGVALLAGGTLLCLLALVVAVANPTAWGARRLAGVLVGLAAPALAGGVVVILPASPRLRAAAAIGASLTVLGVAGFWRAYPEHWMGHGRELTPYVTGIYFLGMLTIALCLFAGIATFKHRNDPGGTVSLVVGEGETRIVEVESGGGLGGLGGVGFLGGTPEGDVETQTNRPGTASVSDGGTAHGGTANGSHGGTADAAPGGTAGTARGNTGATGTSASSDDGGADDGAAVDTVGTGGRFQSSSPGSDAASDSSTPGLAGSSSSGTYGSSSETYGSSTDTNASSSDTYGAATSGTSTAEPSTSGYSGPSATSPNSSGDQSAVSDGGAGPEPLHRPKGDTSPATSPDAADRYCGNCEHFSYVKTEQGMTPYCGFTSEYMEDVEACEDWSPNAGRK